MVLEVKKKKKGKVSKSLCAACGFETKEKASHLTDLQNHVKSKHRDDTTKGWVYMLADCRLKKFKDPRRKCVANKVHFRKENQIEHETENSYQSRFKDVFAERDIKNRTCKYCKKLFKQRVDRHKHEKGRICKCFEIFFTCYLSFY